MSCHHEGSTHFACDCVLKQLSLADALATAIRNWRQTGRGIVAIGEALAAYEKARGLK